MAIGLSESTLVPVEPPNIIVFDEINDMENILPNHAFIDLTVDDFEGYPRLVSFEVVFNLFPDK